MTVRPNTLAFVSLFGARVGQSRIKLHPQHEDKENSLDATEVNEKRQSIVSQLHTRYILG
jgi:hypothetical protein